MWCVCARIAVFDNIIIKQAGKLARGGKRTERTKRKMVQ